MSALPHRHPAGETGADRGDGPAGRELLERRDRAGLGERVPQVRDEHRRTEPDPLGAQRRERGDHPDVGIQRGRVEQPRALVAEPLGLDDVLDGVETRWKCAGKLHWRACYECARPPGE